MAKLSARGRTKIGTIYTLRSAKRFMSDGTVLKNDGFGWKVHATVKNGFSPQQAFERAKEVQERKISERPAYAAFRKELHAMCGVSKRWKLLAAIEMMPEDCDGVWSEACDGYGDNISADVDEVDNLCRLYLNAIAENKEMAI